MIWRAAIVALLVCSCCYPERRESTVERAGLPDACAGYASILRAEGEGATLTLRTPDGRAPSLAFWAGAMSGSSALVTGGDPALVSCGDGCFEATGELRGDVCAEALWAAHWRWHLDPRSDQ